MRWLRPFLAVLISLSMSAGAFAQGDAKLNLVIVEGEGAINNVRQRTAREPIVQVEDENHKPVAGAVVVFLLPNQYQSQALVYVDTNTLLGQDGIVGLKTGSTQASGGCLLSAAREEVNGRTILVVAATFGQPGTAGTILPNALQAGHNLVLTLDSALDPQGDR